METFLWPRLIPKHLTGSEAPNCESSVSRFGLNRTQRVMALRISATGWTKLSTPRREPPPGIFARRVAMAAGKRRDTLLPSRTRQR
jgi:hypothetical protein